MSISLSSMCLLLPYSTTMINIFIQKYVKTLLWKNIEIRLRRNNYFHAFSVNTKDKMSGLIHSNPLSLLIFSFLLLEVPKGQEVNSLKENPFTTWLYQHIKIDLLIFIFISTNLQVLIIFLTICLFYLRKEIYITSLTFLFLDIFFIQKNVKCVFNENSYISHLKT